MNALYPTKTRLALLRAVSSGNVVKGIHDEHTYLLNYPDPPQKVNARIEELLKAGWVDLAEPWFEWELTNAGRAVLDAHPAVSR